MIQANKSRYEFQAAAVASAKPRQHVKIKSSALTTNSLVELANALTLSTGRCPTALIRELQWRAVCQTERALQLGSKSPQSIDAELKQTLSRAMRYPEEAFKRVQQFLDSDDIDLKTIFVDDDFVPQAFGDLFAASTAVQSAVRKHQVDNSNCRLATRMESENSILVERIEDLRRGIIWQLDPRGGRHRLDCRDQRKRRVDNPASRTLK